MLKMVTAFFPPQHGLKKRKKIEKGKKEKEIYSLNGTTT